MDKRSADKLFMRSSRSGAFFAAALAGFTAFELPTTNAFAQDGRILSGPTYARGNTVEQGRFLHALGAHPVLDAARPRMTRGLAVESVAALGNRVNSVNGTTLTETLSYLGTENQGGALATELAAARVDAATGDASWTDVTARVEAYQTGTQLAPNARVEVRRAAVDSRRVIPGMTYWDEAHSRVGFDTTNYRIGGRGNGESTTALEIRITNPDGSTQLFGYMDDCGNITSWSELAPVTQAAAAVENPCPDHTRVSVEGLPQDADVTAVLAVDLSAGRNLHTVDGQMCPSVSLAETCAECTSHVAVATVTEIAAALHKRYGLLSAQTYQAHGGTLNIEIPPTITLTVGGREVTIDVNQAIRDGVIAVALSCPRNEHGRGEGHTGLIETSDWTQSRDGRDGESTLSMRYANGVYRVNPQN